MFSRFGLRFRMTASYVLVSAAGVLLVEAALLTLFTSGLRQADHKIDSAEWRARQAESAAAQTKIQTLARELAVNSGYLAASAGRGTTDAARLDYAAAHGFKDDFGLARGMIKSLVAADGRPVATVARETGDVVVPAETAGPAPRSGFKNADGHPIAWATHPVRLPDHDRTIGVVYAELPLGELLRPGAVLSGTPPSGSDAAAGKEPANIVLGPTPEAGEHDQPSLGDTLLIPGAVVLALLLPVGALFGLFSTRRLIRRIRRLADGTAAMAGGDLGARIPESGGDELGRLEKAFNTMAERLEAALDTERALAGSQARRAERTRITRELHDSISQDLFSANLLAGGLRCALPDDSPLRRQAESMESTLERTMREMRAMLLELRPVALEDAGLAAALEELCQAYEARMSIPVSADIGATWLEPPVEHAVLRVVQEALGNAVRHGAPERIEVRVAGDGGRIEVMVRDDGRGFDPRTVAGRHGMGLEMMRERVGELGGSLEVVSAPGDGTTVRVLL